MGNESGTPGVSLIEIAGAFLKLGALSYGGPALMGIMQADIQERRRWITRERFLEGLGLVNMLPGPIAAQLAIFLGYERAGWKGGVTAGVCFALPAFIILMLLTLLYTTYGNLTMVRHAFYGIGPVVLGIFLVAVVRLGRNALRGVTQIAIAVASGAIVATGWHGIAATLLLAGCVGVALYHSRKYGLIAFAAVAGLMLLAPAAEIAVPDALERSSEAPTLANLGLFFLKVGAFTFGGGITVLAFIQQQLVSELHWLTEQEFLDGLALGQLTPGPIVMLAAYVGYKLAGFAGAVTSTVAIFLPAFVLTLSLMQLMRRLKQALWLKAAMKAIGAAVVGTLVVSLLKLVPHAAPDAFAFALLVGTVVAMLSTRISVLALVLSGAAAGILARLKPLQRLKELA